MSTLSKIFVVLTLLLSIGYCVAAAFLFAYSQDYRAMYEEEQAEHKKDVEEGKDKISALESNVTTLTSQNTALDDESKKLTRDNSELNGKLADTQQRLEDVDQAYKTLNETHMTLARTNADNLENLKSERKEVANLNDRLKEAIEQNDDLTNETVMLKDDKDKLNKKLLATRKELHKSEEKLKEYEDVLARIESSGIKIPDILLEAEPMHGQVLAVDPETDIVVISVGNNANVAKGMKLSVYREDKFVGSLSVISVFEDMSSARILRELTQREVLPGDNVTNQF